MRRDEAIAKLKASEDAIRALGVTSLHLFGSTARDEANLVSDVDVFIEYDKTRSFSLLDLVGVKHALEDELGAEVDVSLREGLHRRLRKRIENAAVRIF